MTTKATVLILGASRGLGLAMAEEWLKRDAEVIATQRRASRDLSELQGRYPASLEIETVDILEAASVHALRERLGGHRIDVLFVNAGICKAPRGDAVHGRRARLRRHDAGPNALGPGCARSSSSKISCPRTARSRS